MKKFLSIALTLTLLICSIPIGGFSLRADASAISEQATYWAMNSDEAKGFIAFIYDTGKVSNEMMKAGNLYTFLTGGYERGSIEELCAKISFLVTAKSNITKCINNYSAVMNDAFSGLMEYLLKRANGSIDDGLANKTLNSVVDSIKSIILTLGNADDAVWEKLEYISSAYSEISSIKGKIEKVKAALDTFHYVWSSANKAPYEYVLTYINNFAIKDNLSDVEGVGTVIDSFMNIGTLDSSACNGAILFYGNDNKVKQVESYGRYIYYVNKSLENCSATIDGNGVVKIIQVHCPTNVYLYDFDNNILASIIDDNIEILSNNILISVSNGEKNIAYYGNSELNVKVVGTDFGTMDYKITELLSGSVLRSVEYKNVPVEENMEYSSKIPKEVQVEADNYNLYKSDGTEIVYTYDSLPFVEDDAVDVTIAEELFDGFPKEVIDLVANTMFEMKPTVDLTSYDITPDDAVALFSAISKYYPAEYSLITGGDFTYKIIISPTLNRITKIRFYYGDDASLSTYQRRVKDLKAEIDALVKKTEGMNEFEKALYVHDYIVLNSEYDLELLDYMEKNNCILPGELRSEKYTEYSILVNGTGVCGSYALAYRAVLNAAGMECLYLSSWEMNHAWNMVKIDGEWYHVDCCWDDSVPDVYGQAKREYFLRTDEEIMKLNHRSWTPGRYKAANTSFSDMPRYYDRFQKYDNGKWYYIYGGKLCCSDIFGKNEEKISEISASALDVQNGDIYYSSSRYINRLDKETKTSKHAYILPKKKMGENPGVASIRNFYIDGDDITMYVSGTFGGETSTTKQTGKLKEKDYSQVSGIAISDEVLSLDVFDEKKLNANIISTGSVDELDIVWSSSDSNVAIVDEHGIITAKNIGEAIITAEVLGFKANCNVTVTGNGLSGLCGNNATWTFAPESGTLTISGTGKMDDYKWGSQPWYKYCKSIERINIANGISSIGMYAFAGHTQITNICFPSSVLSIGDFAFDACRSLASITIMDGVQSIGKYTFYDCTALEKIAIGSELETIDDTSFFNCPKINNIEVKSNNPYFAVYDNAFCDKDSTRLIIYFDRNAISYNINSNVKRISPYAFSYCNLKEISIPNSVTDIGKNAFYDCKLLNAVYIEDMASWCNINFEVAMSNPLYWAERLYLNNSLIQELIIPDNTTKIKDYCFYNAKCLQTVTFNKKFGYSANPLIGSYIGTSAFNNCDNLKSVYIEDLTSWCKINFKSMTSNPLYYAGNLYLNNQLLTNLILPDNITKTNSFAFYNCDSLKEVTITDNVTKLGSNCFTKCDNLQAVHIGVSLSEFSNNFAFCNKLTSINVSPQNTSFCTIDDVLFNYDKTELLVYPGGKETKEYTIPANITSLDGFSENNYLEVLNLPSSINSVGLELPFTVGISPTAFNLWNFYNLKQINVDDNNEKFCAVDGVLYDKSMTKLYCYPAAKKDVVFHVPETLEKVPLTEFMKVRYLRSLIIPKASPCTGIVTEESIGLLNSPTTNTSLEYLFIDNESWADLSIITKWFPKLKKIYTLNPNGKMAVNCETILYSSKESYGENCICIYDEPHEHAFFLMDYVEPTSKSDGYEYYECYCGESNYTNTLHSFNMDNVKVKEPTCTVDGHKSATCTNCGETEIIETIPAVGKHDYKLVSTTPGDCVNAPTSHYTCSVCGDSYDKVGKIDDGHAYKDTVIEPTCTEKGYTKSVCEKCGETAISDFVSPRGHSMKITHNDSYCSAHDTLEYKCVRCNYTESVAADTSKLTTKTTVVEPTCTKSGSESQVCVLCGATVSTKILNPLSHRYSDEFMVDIAATCTKNGSKSKHCIRCDAKRNVTVIEATGHRNTRLINIIEATCTNNGYSGDTFCSDCNSIIEKGMTTEMIAHNYKSVITNATCIADGFTTHTCTACGKNYVDSAVPAKGHSYKSFTNQPTCEEDGSVVEICTACKYSRVVKVLKATGHSDSNADGVCDSCGKLLEKDTYCPCNCHKTGIVKFFFKIILFFQKLFGKNKVCKCGVNHY